MGRITIDKAPGWVLSLEGKMKQAALRGLLSAGHRLVSVIQNEIIPREERMPVDRGIYRAGWRTRKVEDGVLVYNNTPAAAIIEDGARADHIKVGRKMIEALTEWVIRKGMVKDAKKENTASAARQMAWAIAQSMKKNGIFNKGRGLKILLKARRRAPEIIAEEVKREIAAMPR